jgi:hypothetical protein
MISLEDDNLGNSKEEILIEEEVKVEDSEPVQMRVLNFNPRFKVDLDPSKDEED